MTVSGVVGDDGTRFVDVRSQLSDIVKYGRFEGVARKFSPLVVIDRGNDYFGGITLSFQRPAKLQEGSWRPVLFFGPGGVRADDNTLAISTKLQFFGRCNRHRTGYLVESHPFGEVFERNVDDALATVIAFTY